MAHFCRGRAAFGCRGAAGILLASEGGVSALSVHLQRELLVVMGNGYIFSIGESFMKTMMSPLECYTVRRVAHGGFYIL